MEYYLAIKSNKTLTYATHMDEPWRHYAKGKKPDTKTHTFYDSIYMKWPK